MSSSSCHVMRLPFSFFFIMDWRPIVILPALLAPFTMVSIVFYKKQIFINWTTPKFGHYLLTLILFQSFMTYFLPWNTKGQFNAILATLLNIMKVNKHWGQAQKMTEKSIKLVHMTCVLYSESAEAIQPALCEELTENKEVVHPKK